MSTLPLGTRALRTVTAAAIRRTIASVCPDAPVAVQMTGGGVATICIGACPHPSGGRYRLAVGSGTFDYRDPELSTFVLGDGCTVVGPDDDGTGPYVHVDRLADLAEYLRSRPTDD